jgi:hypothetical protein
MRTPSAETEWSAQACRYRFQMDYDFTFRSALGQQSLASGLAFEKFGSWQPPKYLADLPDRRFPRLICSCDSNESTWVLVDIDRMLAFPDDRTTLVARRR